MKASIMANQVAFLLRELICPSFSCGGRRALVRKMFEDWGTSLIKQILPTLKLELKYSIPNRAIRLPLLYLLGVGGVKAASEIPEALQVLEDAIWSPDKATRIAGIYSIVMVGGVEAASNRLISLSDPSHGEIDPIRLFALRAIYPIARSAVDGAEVMLRCVTGPHEHPAIRRLATRILSRMGPASPSLLGSLRDTLASQIPSNLGVEIVHTLLQIGGRTEPMCDSIRAMSRRQRSNLCDSYATTLLSSRDDDRKSAAERLVLCVTNNISDGELPRDTAISIVLDAIEYGKLSLAELNASNLLQILNCEPEDETQIPDDDLGSSSLFERVDEFLDSLSSLFGERISRIEFQAHALKTCSSWRLRSHMFEALPHLIREGSGFTADLKESIDVIGSAICDNPNTHVVSEVQIKVCAINAAKSLLSHHADIIKMLLDCLGRDEHIYVRRAAAGAIAIVDDLTLSRLGVASDWFVSRLTDVLESESLRSSPSSTVVRHVCFSLSRVSSGVLRAADILKRLSEYVEPTLAVSAINALASVAMNRQLDAIKGSGIVRGADTTSQTKEVLTGFVTSHKLPAIASTKDAKVGKDVEFGEGEMGGLTADEDLWNGIAALQLPSDVFCKVLGFEFGVAQKDSLFLSERAKKRLDCILNLTNELSSFVAFPQAIGSFLQQSQSVLNGKTPVELLLADECEDLLDRIRSILHKQQ
jgi:hypothetical protein